MPTMRGSDDTREPMQALEKVAVATSLSGIWWLTEVSNKQSKGCQPAAALPLALWCSWCKTGDSWSPGLPAAWGRNAT